ncbi:MAG: hypothetical protein IPK52_27240 [Chloroflexi bacterium]|nr:hypothetical protein [Chloroflexota bacterium]
MVGFSQPILDLWAGATVMNGRGWRASLFQYLVIDLDVEQIVDFRFARMWLTNISACARNLRRRKRLYSFGEFG